MLDRIETRADRGGREKGGEGRQAGIHRRMERQRQNIFFTVIYKRRVKFDPLTMWLRQQLTEQVSNERLNSYGSPSDPQSIHGSCLLFCPNETNLQCVGSKGYINGGLMQYGPSTSNHDQSSWAHRWGRGQCPRSLDWPRNGAMARASVYFQSVHLGRNSESINLLHRSMQ